MKLNTLKLNARGFSHDIVLILFVVIFAIGGVAYIVASRAYGCEEPVSGAVSSEVSGEVSGPVSEDCPVSEAVSEEVSSGDEEAGGGMGGGGNESINTAPAAKTDSTTTPSPSAKTNSVTTQTNSSGQANSTGAAPTPQKTIQSSRIATSTPSKITAMPNASSDPAAKCVIAGVPPKPSYKQRINPALHVTNTSGAPFRPSVSISATTLGANGKQIVNITNKLLPLLASGQTETLDLGTYRIPFSTNQVPKITYSVTSTSPKFNCSASATLPKSSVWSSFLGLFR